METNNKIGTLIKNTRKESGIKSVELANKINVSQGTISNIENGKFTNKSKSTIKHINNIIEVLSIRLPKNLQDYLEGNDDLEDFPGETFLSKSTIYYEGIGMVSDLKISISAELSKSINLEEIESDGVSFIKSVSKFERDALINAVIDFINENKGELLSKTDQYVTDAHESKQKLLYGKKKPTYKEENERIKGDEI